MYKHMCTSYLFTYGYTCTYSCFIQRKEKQALQPVMKVARFSERCWNVVSQPLQQKKFAITARSCLREVREADQFKLLTNFVAIGCKKTELKHWAEKIKVKSGKKKV